MPLPALGLSTERLQLRGMWGEPKDRAAAVAMLRRAVQLGVDLIEVVATAGPLSAEDVVRDALHPYPADLVLVLRTAQPERAAASAHRLAVARIDLILVPPARLVDALGAAERIGLIEPTDAAIAAAAKLTPIAAARHADEIDWLDGTATPMVTAATPAEVEEAVARTASTLPSEGPG